MTIEKIEELCEGVDDGNRFGRFTEIINILLDIIYCEQGVLSYDDIMNHQPLLLSITDPKLFVTTAGFAMLMDYDENDMASMSGASDRKFEYVEGLVCGQEPKVGDYKYLKAILNNMGEWEE